MNLNFSDHYTLPGNCPPTPPLSQHFALSEIEGGPFLFMCVLGYVFDSRFSEWKIQPISMIFGIPNK